MLLALGAPTRIQVSSLSFLSSFKCSATENPNRLSAGPFFVKEYSKSRLYACVTVARSNVVAMAMVAMGTVAMVTDVPMVTEEHHYTRVVVLVRGAAMVRCFAKHDPVFQIMCYGTKMKQNSQE